MMDPLVEFLKEEIKLLEELLELLYKDREAVMKASPDALEELLESNKRKETLLLKIRMIEEGKKRHSGEGPEVERLQGRIRELLEEIGEQGGRNRLLFEGSLQLIRSMLGMLLPPQAYDAQGRPYTEGPGQLRGRV